ncbi:deoxyhypusine synthase [Candidatus Woesearchaeota archaeon]|nr:deoxyhypusine synthase [Candidatus Woesearchaeota archaeon]
MKRLKKVKQIDIRDKITVNELVNQMKQSGVMGGGRIAKAVDIYEKMIKDKDCKIFLGLAGAMVPGGMKNIIIDMLKRGYIHVLVTTGANLTHDLVESLGFSHYQGNPYASDAELHAKGIDRIYDAFMPNQVYEKMEEFFSKNFNALSSEPMNITQLLHKIGSLIEQEDSILNICYKNKIPIFCPAIADSGIGLMIWGNLAKGKKIQVNAFEDLKEIINIAWGCKNPGVFYIGGGVPKNYVQQAMQFSPSSARYGIQITMDRPEPGGSSGAVLREGISWGKMSADADFVDVVCDATIALPMIYASVKERFSP